MAQEIDETGVRTGDPVDLLAAVTPVQRHRADRIIGHMTIIRLARVYDDPGPDEGTRVLVDRLWPRGMRRDDLRIGRWLKDVAPSAGLRGWYGHRPERYAEFRRRYRAELNESGAASALAELRALARPGPLTLVTATKQIEGSQLGVLKEVLEGR